MKRKNNNNKHNGAGNIAKGIKNDRSIPPIYFNIDHQLKTQ